MLRPARIHDAAGPRLLYLSAQPYYDAYAGSSDRAQRMLMAMWPKGGHSAAYDVCTVCERDAVPMGVLVAFPAEDADALARRFLLRSLPRLGARRWPGVLRHLRASAQVMPVPPEQTLYVDALAVDKAYRRRGVARELLDCAEQEAARRGLRGVSLDTGLENTGAQALYEACGYAVEGIKRAPDERVAQAVGGEGFVSYFKRV